MIKFLETDMEFIQLVPLIAGFSQKTATLFWKNIHEVSATFLFEKTITVFCKEEKMVGYICGYFIISDTFLIAQAYSMDPKISPEGYKMMEDCAKGLGARKILMFTQFEPKVFERFGFHFDRFLLTKEV